MKISMNKNSIRTPSVMCVLAMLMSSLLSVAELPNIVIILADDMGYGELQCLNPEGGKIKTPALDQIASEGMIFTDAHSGSSVCTPTRYGLMTGRYAWRTRLQTGVLRGGDSLIAKETLTIADMLKKKGYDSVMIGKWHLGMKFDGIQNDRLGAVKLGAKVSHGPIDYAGFDEFYGFHYARQMDLWIDNDTVTKKLTAVEMLPLLTEKAVEYIGSRKGKDKPFFMYIPWNAPHSPVVPSDQWKGKSGLNAHADFVMQTDDSYGQVIAALKANGLYENTLVICSADNGTSAATSKKNQLEQQGHFPSADLRGAKSDIWEGGHRVPFIVSWPRVVKAGSRSDALVCLTDLMATAAEVVAYPLAEKDAVDSFSFLPALKGRNSHARESVIHHSINGLFAIRGLQWKLACCPGSGGWSSPNDAKALASKGANSSENYQLYDIRVDLAELNNLSQSQPELVKTLRQTLRDQIDAGSTRPGASDKNDVDVMIDKWRHPKKRKKNKK